MAKQKKRINKIFKYIKSRLGYAARPNQSMYSLCAKALVIDGFVQDEVETDKYFCFRYKHHIESYKPDAGVVIETKITKLSKKIKYATKATGYCHPKLGTQEYKDFYSGDDWRKLRYLVIKNNKGACMCCGATAKDGIKIHVDHIKPRSRYPELELSLDNMQLLCEDCNLGKGAWDDTDWTAQVSE